MTKNWMATIEITNSNQIPNTAPVGQVYKVVVNKIYRGSWKVCKNWIGYVFAATCDSMGMVWGEEEIVLRIEDGKDLSHLR